MDIGRVIARSLELAWRHKFLWVFGFIMALTGGGGGNNFNYSFNRSNFSSPNVPSPRAPVQPEFAGIVLVLIACAACLVLLLLILVLYVRFVSRGALVTSVRDIEKGAKPTLGSAWREGHRYYGRLLGLGFLFFVPLFIFTILILAVSLLPFIGSLIAIFSQVGRAQPTPDQLVPALSGFVGFIVLICCAIICILIVHLIIHPVYEFAVRGIVLEELGTFEGVTRGYRRLRENLGPVALLYLVLIGARIGWYLALTVVSLPLFFVISGIVLAAAATNSAGVIAFIALAIGLPVGLVLVFVAGLFEVFESNAWTEGYLALLAPSSSPSTVAPTPVPAQSG